jgi:hypothetical protein
MDLDFGVSAYKRDRGNLPELAVVNMFVESAVTEPKQVALQSRPGLIDNAVTSGAGPVKGIFQQDGVLSGALFTVSAGSLYSGGVSKGAIAGSGFVNFAGNEIGLAVNAGAGVYFYDGLAVGLADFPDAANVCKVMDIGGRFIAIRTDTGKLYNTEVLENALVAGVLTFGALAFATAEDEPDPLVDGVVVGRTVALGGSETVEFWQITGDSLLPLEPILGRAYTKGVRATGCMAEFDNSAVFVSTDNLVYRCDNEPMRISDPGIEERIAASTTCSIFTHFFEGHEFLHVRLDTETMVYDAQTQQWCEWATSGETNFIGQCAVSQNGAPIFGSSLNGKTLAFGDVYTDLDGPLERRFRAGKALDGGSLGVNNLRLRTNPGQTTYLAGQYADPVVEMAYSRDGGEEFSAYRSTKLGAAGKHRKQVEWRALGTFDAPGMLFDIRCTDPVPFRVSGVTVNEDGGGRSR